MKGGLRPIWVRGWRQGEGMLKDKGQRLKAKGGRIEAAMDEGRKEVERSRN